MHHYRKTLGILAIGTALLTGPAGINSLSSQYAHAQDSPEFKDPDRLAAWNEYVDIVNKGVTAMNAGNNAGGAEHLEKAAKIGETHFPETKWLGQCYSYLGAAYVRDKKYANAIIPYEKALVIFVKEEDYPQMISTSKMLGFLLAQTKEYDKALDAYQTIVLLAELGVTFPKDVKFSSVMRDMATVYQLKGDDKAAKETFSKAFPVLKKDFAKDPVTMEVANLLGGFQFQDEQYVQALETFSFVILDMKEDTVTQREAHALLKIGQIYLIQGDLKNAEPILYKAAQATLAFEDKAPKDAALARMSLGMVYAKKGEHEKAVNHLEKSVPGIEKWFGNSNELFTLYDQLSKSHFALKNNDDAKRWEEKLAATGGAPGQVITRDPRIIEAVQAINVAFQAHENGAYRDAERNYMKALALFEEAEENGDMYIKLNNNIARMFLEQEKYKRAIPYFRTSLNLLQERQKNKLQQGEILTGLAECYMHIKKVKQARDSLGSAVKLVETEKGKDAKELIYIYDTYARALRRGKRNRDALRYENLSKKLREKHNIPASVVFMGLEG